MKIQLRPSTPGNLPVKPWGFAKPRLRTTGVRGNASQQIQSYLSNRKQYVQ